MDVDGGNLGLMEVTNNFLNPAKVEHLGFLQNLHSNNPNPCNGQMLACTRWNKKTNPQKFHGICANNHIRKSSMACPFVYKNKKTKHREITL